MLRVSARRVIGEQGEPRELRLPDADLLGQRVEELLHRGGTVETHHLREKAESFQRRDCRQSQAKQAAVGLRETIISDPEHPAGLIDR